MKSVYYILVFNSIEMYKCKNHHLGNLFGLDSQIYSFLDFILRVKQLTSCSGSTYETIKIKTQSVLMYSFLFLKMVNYSFKLCFLVALKTHSTINPGNL